MTIIAPVENRGRVAQTIAPSEHVPTITPEGGLEIVTMEFLTPSERRQFEREGYLLAADSVAPRQLNDLNRQLAHWVEESRGYRENYGPTFDHRPRFDLEPGHRAESPRLRRVNNPAEVAPVYREASFTAVMADMVAELIGPDIKFLHSKINLKLPHTETRVGYHQDFSYVPHTNRDVLTALLMLDEMTLENGCLMVVPGSHLEGQASLWSDGMFRGEVDALRKAECERRAVPITGKAGDVCFMHAELLHGSEPNRSDRPRSLYISMYSATDAFLLGRNSLPNRFEGEVVRGKPCRQARLRAGSIELPETFEMTSFFELQTARAKSAHIPRRGGDPTSGLAHESSIHSVPQPRGGD